jgi:MFS family permease
VWWDAFHFLRIADHGYFANGATCCDQAYFPGYPLTIRALEPLTGNGMLAGLLSTLLAGCAAAAALAGLAATAGGSRRSARTAVLVLAAAPYGVFLSAMYSEALFLAAALAAWWAGRSGRWWLAGVLAGVAAGVRVNGLFLAAGLAIMYVAQARGRRLRPDALALLVPLAVVAGYMAYLHGRTGSWNAWRQAEDEGWHRVPATPWRVFELAVRLARHAPTPDLVFSYWAEIAFALGGLALLVFLLALRRLPEAVYVALSLGVLITSTPLTSVPRYALSWFPAYLLLAELAERRRWRWLPAAAVTVGAPLEGALALAFAAHHWVA